MATAVRPNIDNEDAMRLAAVEHDRFADAVAALGDADWARPTACPAWDVRQLVCHTIGMADLGSGPRETLRQQVKAARRARWEGTDPLTALTAVQVEERSDWTPAQIVREAREIGPRAVRGRQRTPGFVRRLRLPQKQYVGGHAESWTIGFLTDVILTRDVWMHRLDLASATGGPATLSADHDGVVVADIVAEWAARHGSPYELVLTGPAGGRWSQGTGGESLELDAVDFCRTLSGRGAGQGLLACAVPF